MENVWTDDALHTLLTTTTPRSLLSPFCAPSLFPPVLLLPFAFASQYSLSLRFTHTYVQPASCCCLPCTSPLFNSRHTHIRHSVLNPIPTAASAYVYLIPILSARILLFSSVRYKSAFLLIVTGHHCLSHTDTEVDI